nr:thymidylate kinase [Onthophagus taurus]
MSRFPRGILVVFEGLDRSGKSSQSKKLVENLRNAGHKAELVTFPDRSTPIGSVIKQYLSNKAFDLDDRVLHLLFTANRFEKIKEITEMLNNKINVIVDRYSFSGIVYSSIKKGMDTKWCEAPESGLYHPDVVYFLDMSLDDIKSRPGFGDERYENYETQQKVLDEYKKLSSRFGFTHINGNRTFETIESDIFNDCLKKIKQCENNELKYLKF